MARPIVSSDYWRTARTHRSCREAFGSDMQREERWNQRWDRLIVGFAIVIAVVLIPLIALGVL